MHLRLRAAATVSGAGFQEAGGAHYFADSYTTRRFSSIWLGTARQQATHVKLASIRAVRRVVVSAAMGQSILVFGGGGAACPKKIGGSGALAAKHLFSKIPENILFYPKNFLMKYALPYARSQNCIYHRYIYSPR